MEEQTVREEGVHGEQSVREGGHGEQCTGGTCGVVGCLLVM